MAMPAAQASGFSGEGVAMGEFDLFVGGSEEGFAQVLSGDHGAERDVSAGEAFSGAD